MSDWILNHGIGKRYICLFCHGSITMHEGDLWWCTKCQRWYPEDYLKGESKEQKYCSGCINLKLYAGSGTGECDIHQKDGWIGTMTEACDRFWPNTQICLTCKHWDAVKFKGKSTHWGSCTHWDEGVSTHKCECYCSHWEERDNVKEYLDKIVKGEL